MKTLYKAGTYFIGGYPAVSIDSHDKVLAGARGEIREYGKDLYTATYILPDKCEKQIIFNNKDLKIWISRLEISMSRDYQLPYANNPNKKHD